MEQMKKLPDAEFEVMKVVWDNEPPTTTSMVMEHYGNARNWKHQSAITLLLRLVERGFLRTEKTGKERSYYPLVSKEEYLKFETENFIKRFHNNSLSNLIDTLYGGKTLTDEAVDKLLKLAKERRG